MNGTVVIGLGNPLMGDDGLGLAALERLRDLAPTDVELVDGGTWGMLLLPLIESADRVLFLDAIDADATPGTQLRLAGDEVPRYFSIKLSPHEVDLREVLALAELRGRLPATVLALGIQPARVEWGAGLSAIVTESLPTLVARALEQLGEWREPQPARREPARA